MVAHPIHHHVVIAIALIALVTKASAQVANPVCREFGFHCEIDGCRSYTICTNIGATTQIQRCAGQTPFCTNNACTITPDPNKPQCSSTTATGPIRQQQPPPPPPPPPADPFICTAAGMFPDPFNCNAYVNCSAASGTVTRLRCGAGQAYDSTVRGCRQTTAPARLLPEARQHPWCSTQMCRPRRFGNVPYAPNPAYYVLCAGVERLVYRCPDERNQVFDAKAGGCVYRCPAAGHFADRLDCKAFYSCTKRGSRFTVQRNACGAGDAFRDGRCQPEGSTPCRPEIVAE